jgi:hypothetical protein
MKPKQTKSILVLRLLDSDGPLTMAQIIEKIRVKTTPATVRKLSGLNGFIATTNDCYRPAYALTEKGRSALHMPDNDAKSAVAIKSETKITLADATPIAQRPLYCGAELRPFTGRPGSMRAFSLPSRGIGA